MDITTASKFEYNIPNEAKALNIPPIIYKLIIQRLFGMGSWKPIPDVVSFIEISKLYPPDLPEARDVVGPVIINGVDTITIGLREGEGTDSASVTAYLCKAAKTVMNLAPWADQMNEKLK